MPTKYRYSRILLPVALAASVIALSATPPAESGIEGKVTYTGTPPKMKPIDMAKEPTCAKEHNPPEMTQNVVTGPGNALQYVVVYISAGEQPSPPPSQSVRYDQKGCMYIPHVLPMQAGQELMIYTDDPFAHNIHPTPKINPEWNKSQPPGAPPIDTKWDKPEFIPVKCNIHPWMHGYFVVLRNSHYSVTDNNGAFSLKGLAPGKYTVTAWQEQYGTQSQDVAVSGGETKTINFVFKVTPYLY
jgi:Carboxypeptidase regulatory-like domain